MANIRKELERLQAECEQLCEQYKWEPSYRLIYTSVETFEQGNGFAIVGINPAGGKQDADNDDPNIPFRKKQYSAYLDDDWRDNGIGQSPFQRAVQGIAMILTRATVQKTMRAVYKEGITPEERTGSNTANFLRETPSLNIIPFRSPTPDGLPDGLRRRGEQIVWELLCLANPKPRYIITLANQISGDLWKTILKNSGQPLKSDCEMWVNENMRLKYREVTLREGPLKGALVLGLPAVVRYPLREGITRPLFEIFRRRLQRHGVVN